MKENFTLTVVSLLSVLFMTVHMTQDIVRGMEPGTLFDLVIVPVVVLQLYGTLVLVGKRSGYGIVLVVSVLELVVPAVHMKGAGVGAIAQTGGGFFFVWMLFALATTALFCVLLAGRGLWLGRAR